TCCEWAGLPIAVIPPGVEGGSIVSLVAHEGRGEVKRSREELVFHFPHYQGDDGPHSAIRTGSLKLLRFYEDDRVMLFDLAKDAGERDDLARRMPADADRLRKRLEQYLAAVDAQMPTPNPAFDPAQPLPREKGKNRNMKRKK
ncbi:MAG: sulfatase/phosphatase domain-containing protein, partial [Planctomycetia bacterium]